MFQLNTNFVCLSLIVSVLEILSLIISNLLIKIDKFIYNLLGSYHKLLTIIVFINIVITFDNMDLS